jgi:hypothetical protein
MLKNIRKVVVFLAVVSLSFGLMSSEVQAMDAVTVVQGGIDAIVSILPWTADPPPEECTCPDHMEMCMGGMHGGGDCEVGCPMDMGSCNMMGDCHGGGVPAKDGTQKK